MNIYEFIPSGDIRSHCEKLGHSFTSLESAYLIYHSPNHTLAQKHEAWQELIETMPDMEIEERLNCRHYDSLHDFLRQYMALEDRLLQTFFQDDPAFVYRFDTLYDPQTYYALDGEYLQYHGYEQGEHVYPSFSNGLASEIKAASYDEYLEDLLHFSVTKMKIRAGTQEKPWKLTVKVDLNGIPLAIDSAGDVLKQEEEDIYFYSFDGMWIDVPTPFQRGDIVFTNRQKYGFPPNPFVLTDLCTDQITESDKKIYARLLKKGDESDMTSYGYFLNDDGHLYYECDHDYLSLEYFDGDLTGTRRVLKVLQAYCRKQLDVADCMDAYHYILLDEQQKRLKSQNNYLKDFLEEKKTDGKV